MGTFRNTSPRSLKSIRVCFLCRSPLSTVKCFATVRRMNSLCKRLCFRLSIAWFDVVILD